MTQVFFDRPHLTIKISLQESQDKTVFYWRSKTFYWRIYDRIAWKVAVRALEWFLCAQHNNGHCITPHHKKKISVAERTDWTSSVPTKKSTSKTQQLENLIKNN